MDFQELEASDEAPKRSPGAGRWFLWDASGRIVGLNATQDGAPKIALSCLSSVA